MLFFYKHPDGADDVGDMLQHIACRYVIFTNLYKSKHSIVVMMFTFFLNNFGMNGHD